VALRIYAWPWWIGRSRDGKFWVSRLLPAYHELEDRILKLAALSAGPGEYDQLRKIIAEGRRRRG
jgi:hypothetical protein